MKGLIWIIAEFEPDLPIPASHVYG